MTIGRTLDAAILSVAEGVTARVRVAVSCEVLAYDRASQTVRVRALVAEPAGTVDGLPAWDASEPIEGVPVAWLRAGSVTLTAGVEAGDVGLLLIRDRSHDEVDAGQGASPQTEPASGRRWSLADAVYLPVQVVPAGAIGSGGHRADGAPVLAMGSGLALRVGGSGASVAMARADRVDSRLDALELFASTHQHTATMPGTGLSGTVSSAPSGSSTASTRLFTDDT